MHLRWLDRPFLLWLLLIGLSGAALAVFEGRLPAQAAGSAIMLIAALKSRLVIMHYMEARRVPRRWKFLYDTWNFSAAALIAVANFVTLLARH